MNKNNKHLAQTFADESANSAKNTLRARKADKEGRVDDARLFRALAKAEKVHANKALTCLQGRIRNTAIHGEKQAAMATATAVYRDIIQAAAAEEPAVIESTLIQFMKTTGDHPPVPADQSADSPLYVCQACGLIAQGTVPDRCPVCQAPSHQFELTR